MSNHNFLASDDQNPDFVGASNPDSRLYARFFKHPVQNNFKSEQEGRPIYDDVDMVEIQVPGDKTTAPWFIVTENHKRRFPQQWAHFKNQHEGDQSLAGKTPLQHWSRLTPAQVATLKHLNFLSVEDVAGASDTQLQSIGMSAGMDPYKFREAAQRFIKLASDDAAAAKSDERANALQSQLDAQAEEMAQMRAQFAAMAAANQAPSLDLLAAGNQAAEAAKLPAAKRGASAA